MRTPLFSEKICSTSPGFPPNSSYLLISIASPEIESIIKLRSLCVNIFIKITTIPVRTRMSNSASYPLITAFLKVKKASFYTSTVSLQHEYNLSKIT